MSSKYVISSFVFIFLISIQQISAYWPIGIVRFGNTVCNTFEGYDGTCYRRGQCTQIGGTVSGLCANGIGGCCLFQRTCGDSSTFNNTYFSNSGYPGTVSGASSCTFNIVPCNNNICQAVNIDRVVSDVKAIGWGIPQGAVLGPNLFNICNNGLPSLDNSGDIFGFPNDIGIFTFCSHFRNMGVRLDFLNFILAQPDGNGNCIVDSMIITGSGSNPPIICGENSGQHMYLMVSGTDPITVTITTSAATTLERSWNIKVTQIACDCPTQAPVGCLQYYTDLSGTISSFNYGTALNGNNVVNGALLRAGTRQIANTNYGICVNMQPGYCSIQWSQGADPESFTVSGDSAVAFALNGLPSGGLINDNCTTDYVVVPNPFYPNGTAVGTDRFCGNAFPTVLTFSKPFILTTVTDGDDLPDAANRGFSLSYTQMACSNLAFLMFTSK